MPYFQKHCVQLSFPYTTAADGLSIIL